MKLPLGLVLMLVGCGRPTAHLLPAWTDDREVLVVLTDELGGFVTLVPQLYSGGEPIVIEAPGLDVFGLVAHAYPSGAVVEGAYAKGGPGNLLPDAELYSATIDAEVEAASLVPSGTGNRFDLRDLDPVIEFSPCEGVTVEPIPAPHLDSIDELCLVPSGRIFATANGLVRPVRVIELVDRVFEDRYEFPRLIDLDLGTGLGWDGRTLWAASYAGQIAALDLDGAELQRATYFRQIHGVAAADGIAIAWSPLEPAWLLSATSTIPEVVPGFPIRPTGVFAERSDLVYVSNTFIHSRRGTEWRIDKELGVRGASYIHGNGAQLVTWVDLQGGFQRLVAHDQWTDLASPRDELVQRAFAVGARSVLTIGAVHTTSFWDGAGWCSIDLPEANSTHSALITADHRLAYISATTTEMTGIVYRVQLPVVP